MKWMKRLFKAVLFTVLTLLALVFLWWLAATIRGDDMLEAGFEEFFHLDLAGVEADNGALAMRGLLAPAAETDSYGWALEKLRQELAQYEAESHLPAPNKFDQLMMYGMGYVPQRPSDAPSLYENAAETLLEFKGKSATISGCPAVRWVRTGPFVRPAACEPAAIAALAADNALLLTRYRTALDHAHYFDPSVNALYGKNMISLQELYLAQLAELSKTDRAQALTGWLGNMEFYNRAVAGKVNLVQLSILLVNRGLAQRALPAILGGDAALTARYRDPLLQALRPIMARDAQVEYEAKIFYQAAKPYLEMVDNYNRNKFYRMQQAMVRAWKAPSAESGAQWEAIKRDYSAGTLLAAADWHSPFYSVLTNLVMGGMLAGGDLRHAMDLSGSKSRLLALYVELLAQQVPLEGVDAFLAESPAELRDPLYGKPYAYDRDKKMLYFTYPVSGGTETVMEGILLD